MTRLIQSEHNIQAAFVDSVLWEYKNDPTFIRPLFFAVPNGSFLGGGNPISRARVMEKLKKEGLFPGVSDILYLQARGDFSSLAMEFKIPSRRREERGGLSEDQFEFLEAVAQEGGAPFLVYSVDEALASFAWYMNLDRYPHPARSIEIPNYYVTIAPLGDGA